MKLKWWSNKVKIENLKFKTFLIFSFSFSLLVLSFNFACSNKTTFEYMPDMSNQPALKAQKYAPHLPHHRAMLEPPAGTIPRDYVPYPYKEDPEGAGQHLKNPLPVTQEILAAGQKHYNTFCFVCHGSKGYGDGPVIPSFPKPPSLQSEKVRQWPDGRIFHVITMGQNLMPSYASQVPTLKRWAIIRYLRAMQQAEAPPPEEVEAYKKYRTEKKK